MNSAATRPAPPGATRAPQLPAWPILGGALVLLAPGIPPGAGLGAGLALGLLGLDRAPDRTRHWAHVLLQASVIGLGAGLDLLAAVKVGAQGFGAALLTITFTLAAGRWLGRKLGINAEATLLIGAGTAICGGSAIAALAAALRPRAANVSIALATIFLLNAVALVAFPPLGHFFGLGQVAFGWWAALAIHDTSSVVGAGLAYGPVALAVATAVKLSRALWLIPLTLALVHRQPAGAARGAVRFPWFIAGFVAMMAARYLLPAEGGLFHLLAHSSQRLLTSTLFLIGCGITRPALQAVGVRPLLLGLALWGAIATATLVAARAGVWGP